MVQGGSASHPSAFAETLRFLCHLHAFLKKAVINNHFHSINSWLKLRLSSALSTYSAEPATIFHIRHKCCNDDEWSGCNGLSLKQRTWQFFRLNLVIKAFMSIILPSWSLVLSLFLSPPLNVLLLLLFKCNGFHCIIPPLNYMYMHLLCPLFSITDCYGVFLVYNVPKYHSSIIVGWLIHAGLKRWIHFENVSNYTVLSVIFHHTWWESLLLRSLPF